MHGHVVALACSYCAAPLYIDHSDDEDRIQPESILPFTLTPEHAKQSLFRWANSLRWAPFSFAKKIVQEQQFKGYYVPFWTFDAHTDSDYRGERGDYYYVTESKSVYKNGEWVTENERVRKIDWDRVRGNVTVDFNDLVIPASKTFSSKHLSLLEPWDLNDLEPFDT